MLTMVMMMDDGDGYNDGYRGNHDDHDDDE